MPQRFLLRIETQAQRLREAEAQLEAQRLELRGAMREARKHGLTVAAIGRAAGLSRQRAAQMILEAPGE
jgi:hypothetical protein